MVKGIKPQSAKSKGRKLQAFVRDFILSKFPWLGEDDCRSQSMGSAGVDVILSPLARRTLPISIECKKTKKTPNRSELKQSQENAYEDTIAGVVWCPHGVGPDKSMILFDLKEFIDWYKFIRQEYLNKLQEQEEEKSDSNL